jgi:hypothetical protein
MAGFSIELLRLVLVSIIFIWLVGFVFNNTYVQVENFPQPFTRAWLFTPGTAFLILMLVVVASGLTAYHFFWAPDHLRLESQYWNKLKLLEKLWAHTPSAVYGSDFWFNQFSQWKSHSYDDLANAHSGLYRDNADILFRRPYDWYFLYSIATYLLFAIPALAISTRALAHSSWRVFSMISQAEDLLQRKPEVARTGDFLPRTRDAVIDHFDWYSSCLFSAGILALYEALLGYRTLAPAAYLITYLSYLLFAGTIIFPLAALFLWLRLARKTYATLDKLPTMPEISAAVARALKTPRRRRALTTFLKLGCSAPLLVPGFFRLLNVI